MGSPAFPLPYRALLVLFVALLVCLIPVPISGQTIPASSVSSVVPDVALERILPWRFSITPVYRNPLQADPRIVAAFMRPWLLSAHHLDLDIAPTTQQKSTRTVQRPKSYKLTPDPINWTAYSDSPDGDDFAYLPEAPRIGRVNTAQRLASLPEPHGAARTPPAKYDVERIGERSVGEGLNFFSIEKEMALGRQLSLEMEQSMRLFPDPVITEYTNRIGQVLVRHSDCKVPFVIKVVDDDEVNAFALPGGFFYVNTGLILAADDEAELAGVMSHEIAHVCARHATRNLTKGEISQYVSIPLIFFGGPVAYALRQVSSIAMPLSFLKFSRDAEREADLLGMQYQFSAGYDPTALVDFFERIDSEERDTHNFVARAFMTHPMTNDRIRRAESQLENLPSRDTYITDTSEFDEIRDRLSRITHGRSIHGNGANPHPTLRRRTGTP
jgi:hypothetical protein